MIWGIARTGRTAQHLTLAAGLIATAALTVTALTAAGPPAASASAAPGARLLSGPPAVLSVPADGRVDGYGFTATVLGAATARTFDGQSAGPGAQWWMLGLRWQVDPATPAAAVSVSVVADGRTTPLPLPARAATSPDTGPLYWAVPEPAAAPDVTVQAASDNFTQSFSLTHLARTGTDAPVLYRSAGQWQTTVPVNRTDTLPVRGFQDIPPSAVRVALTSVTLTDFGPTGPNDTPPATSSAWLTVALSDQETSTVESVQTPVTAGQVTLTLPGQPAIPATLTPGGGPDNTGPGLFPDRYTFPVPADITTATLTITPTDIDITGGVTTITTTLTPAAFGLTIPTATAPPAPAGPAVRPHHYDTVGTVGISPLSGRVIMKLDGTAAPTRLAVCR